MLADEAVPALIKAIEDSDADVRDGALAALNNVDPEALANIGIMSRLE